MHGIDYGQLTLQLLRTVTLLLSKTMFFLFLNIKSISVNYQLDRLWSHLDNKPPDTSVRNYLGLASGHACEELSSEV